MAIVVLAAATAGCGLFSARLPAPVAYACDDGKGFKVAYAPAGDSATIEINRMKFGLRRAPAAVGSLYACDVLTLSIQDDRAAVVMDGRSDSYANCRVAPQSG